MRFRRKRMHKGIICGRGGQGIITVNRMLGEIASKLGLGAISAETHGMAMRGGSVATYIKIGHFNSPSIASGDADFMIATDPVEAARNIPGCARGSLLIIDSSDNMDFEGMRVLTIDATGIARKEFISEIAAGSILLGAFLARDKTVFERKKVISIINEIFPKAAKAVERGYDEVSHV
jgi:indolepyruvate ferredoxin oxidoreductase, beta subunit